MFYPRLCSSWYVHHRSSRNVVRIAYAIVPPPPAAAAAATVAASAHAQNGRVRNVCSCIDEPVRPADFDTKINKPWEAEQRDSQLITSSIHS